MYLALGSIRREGEKAYNTLQLIGPDGGVIGHYDKRALWGTDWDLFARGDAPGILDIDGVRVGFRICFEIRFPECFRDLYRAGAQLCVISFCDVKGAPNAAHMEIIRAHLKTRAVENIMAVASVNSASRCQTAPTAVFDVEGAQVAAAPVDEEALLVYDYVPPQEESFGVRGRRENIRLLLGE